MRGQTMSRPRLLVGSSTAARRERARSWLRTVPADVSPLLLSAEQESADHLARELAASLGSLFGVRRLTLDAFAYRTALPSLAARAVVSHSRLGQEAVMARAVHQLARENRLGPMMAVAEGPGLVRALTSTLHECRMHRVTAKDLASVSQDAESGALASVLERYEALSEEHGVCDRAAVLDAARRVLLEDSTAIEAPVLLLDVPVTTPVERDLVSAIADKATDVLALVPEGDGRTIRTLLEGLALEEDEIENVPPLGEESESLNRLKTFLFEEAQPPAREETSDVVILSAPGEAQEAVELARAIQEETARGTRFDEIAVLLKSPELYTPLVEDALDRARIPAYFEKGTKRPDPSGRAFLSLLDCAIEELSAARFAEYLSLGQLPTPRRERNEQEDRDVKPSEPAAEVFEQSEEEPLWVPPQHALAPAPRDHEPVQLDLFAEPEKLPEPEKAPAIEGTLKAPWRWEKLLVDAAVIGGLDRWERRLEGLDRELELRWLDIEDKESAEAESLRREREDLAHLRTLALPLVERLAGLPAHVSWGEWLDALERLAASALARPEGVLAMLKELRPMASVGPVELVEVREVLSERLTLLSQPPADYRYGRVWVAPIESARGASFRLVLVPGLAERMFPRKIVEDPLLLDAQRETLGRGLPLQDDRIAAERLALRLAAGAATERLVLGYPSVDLAKGRAKVPSFYLLEVARASRGSLPDFETLEREAASSSGARLGWPAPRSRLQAIDENEFDLAFLADALRRDASESEALGTGRYLVEANECLARSLRARYQRGRYGKFTVADGFLEPGDDAREGLAPHRLEARAYSVTALEKYAGCPYRFYLNAILRLRPRETVESITHLDPLTRGHIVHEAQFHILGRLEKDSLVPLRPDNLDRALSVFETVFDDIEDRFHEELSPAIERIWRDELERIRFDLRGWLRRGAERNDGFAPYRREYTFGMRPRGPADPTSTLEVARLESGLRLRGAIDLVERRDDGKIRITDHKSGKAWMPKGAVLNGGENLQPILYILAYEALTGEKVDSSRLYYCTQRGGYEERTVRLNQESLAVVAEFQRRLDRILEEGFFPASPQPRWGCTYCDYLPVCGPRMDVDARRKQNDPRLSPLNWLRNLT